MDKHERRREAVVVLFWDWDVVHPLCGVSDQVEPEVARYILLVEVGTQHVHHCLPVAFYESVEQLAAGSRVHNVRLLRRELCFDSVAKTLGITVAAESLGKPTRSSAKQIECLLDGSFGECLPRKDPVVACHAIDKDEDLSCAHNGNGVTKANIEVNLIQVCVCSACWNPR